MIDLKRNFYFWVIDNRSKIKYLQNLKANLVLKEKKREQYKKFLEYSRDFNKLYLIVKKNVDSQFLLPQWEEYNSRVEKEMLPVPIFSFLRIPEIMYSMFSTGGGKLMREELAYLKSKYQDEKLKELLEEDYVGEPLLLDKTYLTSHNRIHHLYHITQFIDKTKVKMDSISTIVEWGGGYGNMAKLWWLLKEKEMTYVMIDTPLFSMLQWIYLSTVLGKSNVNLLIKNSDKIKKGKINIVSLSMLKNITIHGDLFVSTWALSESSKYSQDYVVNKKWFGAKHLLLAFPKNNKTFPLAFRLNNLAKTKKAHLKEIDLLKGNYYAFA